MKKETPTGASRLTCLVTEHAMRICDDELMVLNLRNAAPMSEEAFTALGRLLTIHPTKLLAGSPLHCLVTGSEIDELWRDKVQLNEHSLWSIMEFYTTLYSLDSLEIDPLEAYSKLRAMAFNETGL